MGKSETMMLCVTGSYLVCYEHWRHGEVSYEYPVTLPHHQHTSESVVLERKSLIEKPSIFIVVS